MPRRHEREVAAVDRYLARRRALWRRQWAWLVVIIMLLLACLLVYHAAVAAWQYLLNLEPAQRPSWLHPLATSVMPYSVLVDNLAGTAQVLLGLLGIAVTAGLLRYQLELPVELVVAVPNLELQRACRKHFALSAAAIFGLLVLLPMLIAQILDCLPQPSGSISSTVQYYASSRLYSIPSIYLAVPEALVLLGVYCAAAVLIPLRWPRLSTPQLALALLGVLLAQFGLASAAVDLADLLWSALAFTRSPLADAAGFLILLGLALAPPAVLWRASTIARPNFTGAQPG